ncbi:MAG: hypothetical protein JST59_02305 [Actinobacteria bacterium]|nr:hypothetical protein [Actinomycetota bacterium]
MNNKHLCSLLQHCKNNFVHKNKKINKKVTLLNDFISFFSLKNLVAAFGKHIVQTHWEKLILGVAYGSSSSS